MTQRRLIVSLLVFFVALALPSSILVYQAYGQLKWEAFYQHQRLARELTLRIDSDFRDLIAREEKRPISDYEFLNVEGSGDSAFLQRSPLSEFPPPAEVPGLLGYFQVDASGQLRTPLVPETNAGDYGITAAELAARRQQEERIRGILDRNRLVTRSDERLASALDDGIAEISQAPLSMAPEFADAPPDADGQKASPAKLKSERLGQAAFDALSESRPRMDDSSGTPASQVGELALEDRYDVAAGAGAATTQAELEQQAGARRLRKEQVNLPRSVAADAPLPRALPSMDEEEATGLSRGRPEIRIQTFESEVEPMEFALLDSGHFVLFRRVWRDDERQVQGLLIEQAQFVERLVAPAFRESSLSSMSRLIVAWQGTILRSFEPDYGRLYSSAAGRESRELLYQGRLVAPFGDLELIYTLAYLPVGAGGQVIIWSAVVLALVLVGGCLMLWRLGRRQLALARQQQDFVSAVSHELKTPLTSIRMYGEILREGWADENKRKAYYDFIFHEAERLTRLINNVLQLARLSRNEQPASLSATRVDAALDELRPRLESQLEAAGFELAIDIDAAAAESKIEIDMDGFLQIFINLVDNAVKFSANAERQKIDIACRRLRDGKIQFAVRDYGPGIAPDQMKKIFTLFYRSENELTRETVGTGIGLALVQQLAGGMHAEVDVVNCEPGAEFRLRFPAC
jgi:signal transduction histidine kinase